VDFRRVLALATAVTIAACSAAPRISLEIAPAPAPLARTYASFWEAALALDYERAEGLATTDPEREYARAMRELAEGRHDAAQQRLTDLLGNSQAEPRARALLVAVAREGATVPEKAIPSRVDRSFVEALIEARKAERWTFGPEPVRLLIDRGGASTPRVPMRVNGTGALMGIDTGAGLTVIGSELAQAAGAKRLGARTSARDAHGGGVQAELGTVTVDLGGIVIERHPVLIIDSARLRYRTADAEITGYDGVLGWNALSVLRTTLDNSRQTLTFEKSRGAARNGDLFWIGEPYVRARASNGFPLLLFLDTGASHTALSSPAARASGLGAGERGSSLVMGAAGSRTMEITRHRDAALYAGGSWIAFGEMQSMEPRSSGYAVRDGVLGADALTRGRVVIDPAARDFLITP
jgi:predicted aspartyl protease